MNPGLRRELAAAIGGIWPGLYLGLFYGYGLGSALLVGSSSPGAGEAATLLWVSGDLAVWVGVAACLDRFIRSARHLRLPNPAATLARVSAWLALCLVGLPILAFRWLIPESPQLIWVTLLLPACLGWPGLARWRGWRRPRWADRAATRRPHPVRSPSDVIRVYFGSAFAPSPLSSRAIGRRLLVAGLWSLPWVFAATPVGRPLRGWVSVYLGVTAGVLWVWMMRSLSGFIRSRGAVYAELALTPGLGDPASQRRALYRGALTRPLELCALFSALELLWVGSQSPGVLRLTIVTVTLVSVTLLAAYLVVCELLVKRPVGRVPDFLRVYQLSYSPVVFVFMACRTAERLPIEFFGGTALLYVLLGVIAWPRARRLAQLPHPFLQ